MLNPFYPNTNIAILFQNLQNTHRYRESAREWIGWSGFFFSPILHLVPSGYRQTGHERHLQNWRAGLLWKMVYSFVTNEWTLHLFAGGFLRATWQTG